MFPSGEAAWPESLRPLYESVQGTPAAEALAASARWRESFAQWVKGASLEERSVAEAAAWARLDAGERTVGELLFLLSSCVELLWPYASPPAGLLRRLLARRESMLAALESSGDAEGAARVRRETEAVISTVLARYLKRHPESLLAMVEDTPCTFDGRALRFEGAVEVDLKQALGTGAKSIGLLEQLRALLPTTPAEGRDRLADFIRSRAARIPWREASEVLAERLFALATSPEGRSGMSGFLACYPSGRREPDWCARAGMLLSRTLEAGGPPEVVENLCELLARFDAPPVDGLRGALGALVSGDFEAAADLAPVRFVLNHCQATLRKGEPGLVLTLLWLEERLFRASVKKGLPDAFERRVRVRTKLLPWASEFRSLCWLAEECAELWPRFSASGRPGLDELAAWRQEVAARVGRKPVLRKAAIEFFLWCAPEAAASEAELTVLSLVRTGTDRRQVRRLKEHPSSRVRFRVRTLQAWLQGSGKGGAAPAVEPSGSSGPATVTEALRHLHATRAVPLAGRTWLRDRDLEELLLGAVGRVEAEFAARYPERFREDTAELVAGLLEGLRVELERVQADMSALLAQGQSAPLELGFTVRRVPPGSEEDGEPEPQGELFAAEVVNVETEARSAASDSAPAAFSEPLEVTAEPPLPAPASDGMAPSEPLAVTVEPSFPVVLASVDPAMAPPQPEDLTASDSGELKVRPPSAPMEVRAATDATRPAPARPLGVEVAFVLTVDVDGFMRTERAALARVMKLEQRGEGQWMPTFRLAREPLDALLLRSEAAFCLFLAPPIPRPECWMVPARVARGLMETQRSLSGVPREGVQRVARSLAQWLVGELVGLWTGDERPELLEQLRAGKGGPEFIVELRLVGRAFRH